MEAGAPTLAKLLHIVAWACVAFPFQTAEDSGFRESWKGRLCLYVCKTATLVLDQSPSNPSLREVSTYVLQIKVLLGWDVWVKGM